MSDLREITTVVESVLRDHLRSGEVIRVVVHRNDDSADGDVLVIKIVFNSRTSLDSAEIARVGRFIWRRLIEMGEDGFPSLSFISKSEAGKLAAA